MAAASSTPTTGTATPLELDPEEASKSLKVSLADLSAKATALYVHKKYEEAAEVFAQAAEMQAEMNGEMNPENAEILFLYGRALFKVGQSKSDVLGGKAPDVKKPAKPKPAKQAESANGSGPAAAAAAAEEKKKKEKEKEEPKPEQKKALFQFEGDEDFDDSDDSDEGDEDEDEEEDDDDLAVAFEVLDLARVLFNKRLEAAQAEDEARQGKGKAVAEEEGDSAAVRHIKERLADTHDLLAEISLENERYPNAITDSRASLKYKQELYPFESEVIAEAHFKLSLALEFASVTRSSDDDNDRDAAAGGIDQALRDEAAAELEAAINSTRQKLRNKEVELATLHNPDENEATRRQIADVKEVLADMEQRLVDLRKPPVDLSAALGIPPPAAVAGGGAGAGAAPAAVSDEIRSKATDLTGLVRKKRKADDEKPAGDEVEVKKARDAN